VTWLLVMIGWLVFRASDMSFCLQYLVAMFDLSNPGFAADSYWVAQPFFFVLAAVAFVLLFKGVDAFELAKRRRPLVMLAQLGLFVLAVGELLSQGFNPFLYFQF
jgi:alginate O-acetyltransferase complex protein AlgI